MLNSIYFGNSSHNQWEMFHDKYDNTFVGNTFIRQKIRFGKNVPRTFSKNMEAEYVTNWYLPFNTFISNSNKNMNISLMHHENDSSYDDDICFVTFDNNFTIIKYDTECAIIQTYHNKKLYSGLALRYKMPKAGDTLATFIVRNNSDGIFQEYAIMAISDDGLVGYSVRDIPRNANKEYFIAWKRSNEKGVHFKMNPSTIITETVLVVEGNSAINNLKDFNVITIKSDDEEEIIKGLELLPERTRALTVVDGIRIPLSTIIDKKLLYLFNLDSKTGNIKCVKSN